jgi:D-alanine-D-alanine ligase
MDKTAAKERFGEKEIPTPAFRVVEAGDDGPLAEAMETLGPDLVVKPVADGSSIDIAMVETLAGLAEAVRAVWARGEPALIERRILGREFTVGILGETALPMIEIRTPGGWYDCEAAPPASGFAPLRPATWYDYTYKYTSDDTGYVFEHGLEPALEDRMREVALAAHRALGCRDLSRVDLMLTLAGEPEVLEINTIPGFTSHSLVPKAAARAGLSFGRLCERIVALAWARAGTKGRPDANPKTAARTVRARWTPGRGDWQSGSGETFRR